MSRLELDATLFVAVVSQTRDLLPFPVHVRLCHCLRIDRVCVWVQPRLDILINNAAQTLTRPESWTRRMHKLENTAAAQLGDRARETIRLPARRVLEDAVDVLEEPEPEPEQTQRAQPEHRSDSTAEPEPERRIPQDTTLKLPFLRVSH